MAATAQQPTRVDNFKLHRHCADANAPIYICHHCSRGHLTNQEMEPLWLSGISGGEPTIVGPSNCCRECWANFSAWREARDVELSKAPWPPKWPAPAPMENQSTKKQRRKEVA